MTDVSQGAGWWRASDGKWYPPHQHPDYVPTDPAAPVWWKASDGNWYPPESHPDAAVTGPPTADVAPTQVAHPGAWSSGAALLAAPAAPAAPAVVPPTTPYVFATPDPSGRFHAAGANPTPSGRPATSHPAGTPGDGQEFPGLAHAHLVASRTDPAAVASLVLAIVVWPVGLVVALVARRRIRRTGERGRRLTSIALVIAIVLGVGTVGASAWVLGPGPAGFRTSGRLATAVVQYENTQAKKAGSPAATPRATSATCSQTTGTLWTCKLALSNGYTESLPVAVTPAGQGWAPAASSPTSSGGVGAGDREAQSDLSNVVIAAKAIYVETSSYGTTTTLLGLLAQQEPELHYTSETSQGPTSVSVDVADATRLYLANWAPESGSCWMVRDVEQEGGTLPAGTSYASVFGSTEAECSALAATAVSLPSWASSFPD